MGIRSAVTRHLPILGIARRLWRRQTSARISRPRSVQLTSAQATVRVAGVPVAARIDPHLRLDHQQAQLLADISRGLADRSIAHWRLPTGPGLRPLLGVRIADRSATLDALVDMAAHTWYAEPLTGNGGRTGQWLRLRREARLGGNQAEGSRRRALVRAPGLTVWEFVAPSTDSSFVAGPTEGLDLAFWSSDDSGQLTSLVTNRTAVTLPDEPHLQAGAVPAGLRQPLLGTVTFPIDVVLTWVDGGDRAWLREKARAAGAADVQHFTERADDEVRFTDHDELRFSLRALQQFMPWVRKVWIVTADQRPPWLAPDDPWVSVVSHRDIWPDGQGLPTFNSHAIEACLHRIEGLAEHFLYLNDDMIVARPVPPELFFHASGIGNCYQSQALVDFAPTYAGDIASSAAAKNARRMLAERYGWTVVQKFFHTASALTVSGMNALEAEFPTAFGATRRAQFRTLADVAAAGSFYLNWAMITGRVVPGRIRYTYIDPAAPEASARLERLLRRRDFDAFCINDGSREEAIEQRQLTDRLIRSFLARYLPVPGSFELPGR